MTVTCVGNVFNINMKSSNKAHLPLMLLPAYQTLKCKTPI